eukprot:TRINITY_DN7273_c0_g1_i2.p1 TRINITY_DN7273_c0_g1~~TRINITY_DN7273_c0_g1_i2.p1  ORF type:complete len:272 (+),score=62.26 TRINITY_DN7273_c0_g1_i2:129-944(+)
MAMIRHKILVLSGKGGVGKSTVAAQLALSLAASKYKVGLLDIDICGPSAPKILGVEDGQIQQCAEGWVPVSVGRDRTLQVMSIAFLLGSKDEAVVWRGPKKTAMIKQFLTDVYWGELDYLIIDTPPGTSDEHISIVENLQAYDPTGAVVVTTPQAVSIADVRKEISFCRKINLPILGVVENMSGFVCPHCAECTNIFSSEGGKQMAGQLQIPFLGKIPIDPSLTLCEEKGEFYIERFPQSQTSLALQTIVQQIHNQIALQKSDGAQEMKDD